MVDDAKLSVDEKLVSEIKKGLVVFFCVEKNDEEDKLDFLQRSWRI